MRVKFWVKSHKITEVLSATWRFQGIEAPDRVDLGWSHDFAVRFGQNGNNVVISTYVETKSFPKLFAD